jgi:NADPH:quinone reductase-like Zn-dependent oxidoreductase
MRVPGIVAAISSAAMKAILIREHGGVDKLTMTDLPDPTAGPGEAVVRVRAVALNHLDIWLRRGVPGHTFPLPMIPGSEVAGVIESVDDPRWQAGDEVIVAPGYSCGLCVACLSGNDPLCRQFGIFGETVSGGAAEKIAVPVRNLIRKPASLSFAKAAAIPLDMLTAWHMLIARAQLRPGETVLVQAGGSGVGSAAIQIAKLWGATVYTTTSTSEKASRAKALGADETILYTEVDFLDEVRRLTKKRGVDIVFEHVGGETFERSLRALAKGGRLVTCGSTSGGEVTVNLRLVFFKLLSILGSTMGSLAELHEIMKFVEAGKLHPVIDRVLPLSEVAEGHRILEAREAFGKIVFEVG